jgi:hypothetical protein
MMHGDDFDGIPRGQSLSKTGAHHTREGGHEPGMPVRRIPFATSSASRAVKQQDRLNATTEMCQVWLREEHSSMSEDVQLAAARLGYVMH